jgi:hypothetical protein
MGFAPSDTPQQFHNFAEDLSVIHGVALGDLVKYLK